MMGLLVIVQSAIDAVAPWLASAAVVFAIMALGARIAERGTRCEALAQFKRLGLLCPLRTPLGFVPETNCGGVSPPGEPPNSRFWHDALPDGGCVFTWENALVDRLPNHRVSMQVEMRPSGDCVFRYDFQEALDPPATNFVIGAQMGTNGVNALSILGTNILSATVWNVDGVTDTNGVAIAGTSGGICLHGGSASVFTPLIQPSDLHANWRLENLEERNGKLVLSVPDDDIVYSGSATLLSAQIRFGVVKATVSAHRCDSSYSYPYCSLCSSDGHNSGDYHGDDLSLSVRSLLTLKHDNQSTISISHPNSEGTTINNATVQIRRKGESDWLTLGSPSSLNPWTAKIAGTFEMRGIGTVDGKSVETPVEEVEVRFPDHDDLFNDTQVISMANSAWVATLADCSPTNRRERGFWILLDTAANSYEAGPTLYGHWCGTGEDASVGMSPRPPDVPSQPSPTDFGAKYSVASFHCHTPTTYRPATTNFPGRKVGPSKDDKRVDKVDHVPGIVYDYLDSPDGSWNIPPEHPINSPAGIYESFGEERRPTP